MNSILISKYKNRILCMNVSDNTVNDIQLYEDSDIHVRNVYIGRVKNIVKNINAAFIEIAPGMVCFYSLEDVKHANILNRKRAEVDLKQGDELIVQISKGAVKQKAPVCTSRLKLPKDELDRILKIAPSRTLYSVLYSSKPEYLSFFNRVSISEIDKITCDGEDIYMEVDAYMSDAGYDDMRSRLSLYNDEFPVNKLYKVDSIIAELTNKTVWLPSGANIVIEYTEAMTVIDVNTSKSIEPKSDNHILEVNLEAAEHIFRQIKNRNLSGMILIDFINDTEVNTQILIDSVVELCKNDPFGCNYIDITGLGIVEITRTKKYRPIYEML